MITVALSKGKLLAPTLERFKQAGYASDGLSAESRRLVFTCPDNETTLLIVRPSDAKAEVGPVAAPGKYSVRVTVNGDTYTQPLEIIRPPNTTGSESDIQAAVKFQLRIRDDVNTVSGMTARPARAFTWPATS